MDSLSAKKCGPCHGDGAALDEATRTSLLATLGNEWRIENNHHLTKRFTFPDFRTALLFTNRVGEIAEGEGHHPDIHLSWGNVIVTIWTHAVDGLTENDFILAAKAEQSYPER